MDDKIYVVVYVEDYDSFDVSYHRSKKGAYRWIMKQQQYENWLRCRYVSDYDELYYIVREKDVLE